MGAPGTGGATRLNREDFRRTKHDSAFSKWQILIGPSDWEHYEAGKEGAERYRVGNLPAVCGPGLYEIGVGVSPTDSGRNLEPDRIVVVYLGQADNVRSRLQHYGRSGSHLIRHRCSDARESNRDGHRPGWLFKEIFSRGYPIVYRWAPMKSKIDAEQMEVKLLEKFDYAWNKVSNGARRPQDVLNKIEKISLKNSGIPKILKMLQALTDQRAGIPIKAGKPTFSNKKPEHDIHDKSFNFFDRVLKFGRSQPRLASANPKESNQIYVCGIDLGDGSICSKPPVQGRKRCAEHKGRRLSKNLIATHYHASCQENTVGENFSLICGVTQNDGSPCERLAFPGRKRCEKHKGMRVKQIVPKSPDSTLVIKVSIPNLGLGDYCGVDLGDGKCCRRQPREERGVRSTKGCELKPTCRSYYQEISWLRQKLD